MKLLKYNEFLQFLIHDTSIWRYTLMILSLDMEYRLVMNLLMDAFSQKPWQTLLDIHFNGRSVERFIIELF